MWGTVAPAADLGGRALLALAPLAWLVMTLGVLRWAAHKACPPALALAAALAALIWRLAPVHVFWAALDGAVLAVWPILAVIFAALFTFNLTRRTGAMAGIRAGLSAISADQRIQALLIAWGFGAFLEGAAGFGSAVAIPAAVLIGLGFDPLRAAMLCLVANSAPVVFGGAGLPVIALGQVTDLEPRTLGFCAALQLTPFALLLPLVVIWLATGRVAAVRGATGAALAGGLGFAAPQLLIAWRLGPELPTLASALFSMLAIVAWVKLRPPAAPWRLAGSCLARAAPEPPHGHVMGQARAWSPYAFILASLVAASPIAPPLHRALASVSTTLSIYRGPGGRPLVFSWLTAPATLIALSAAAGGLIQGARARDFCAALAETARQLRWTAVTVMSVVALARVMGASGMVAAIAWALASAAGPLYPLCAPFVGALGAFVTGSDTASNVLFGPLQQQTAIAIGADPSWIASANATGATAGKMISPQSVAVAAAATGQTGAEGAILRRTLGPSLLYACLLGLLIFVVGSCFGR